MGDWKLRSKLVATYLLLSLCTTFVTLGGAHVVYARAARHGAVDFAQARAASEVFSLDAEAARQALSYLLVGDAKARKASLVLLDSAASTLDALPDGGALVDPEKGLIERARVGLRDQEEALEEVFGSHTVGVALSPASLDQYERAVDRTRSALDAFRAENERRHTQELWTSSFLTEAFVLLIGLGALVGAATLGFRLAEVITLPAEKLRDAMVAFGLRQEDVAIAPTSRDELGELATAFIKMRADVRRHAEARLESQHILEDIFDSVNEGLIVCESDGEAVHANRAYMEMSGFGTSDLLGTSIVELFEGDAFEGTSLREVHEQDALLRTQDGQLIPVRYSLSPLRGEGRRGWVCVAQNLAERHRLEAELRHSQKMDAVGRLAAGIAHDFNNLLQVIVGNGEAVLEDAVWNDDARGSLAEVVEAGTRASDLTRQLLAFSRRQAIELKVLELDAIVSGMERMLSRLLGSNISLDVSLASGGACVKVDRSQIEVVLLNLVVNARDAMPDGGVITIETREVAGEDPARPSRSVELRVTDTGVGMTPEVRGRIFEPFFTTKSTGTGIGLSTVFGVMKQSAGEISVQSAPGKGSTFTLSFPSLARGVIADASSSLLVDPVKASDITVLLVEDQDGVRKVTRRALARLGYTTLEARGAGEAILACEAHPDIDVVVMDVHLPQMDGHRLFVRLRQMRPNLKVLYMSAQADDETLRSIEADPSFTFLQKPFVPERLEAGIQAVLRAEHGVTA